jgi:hypothetical protein
VRLVRQFLGGRREWELPEQKPSQSACEQRLYSVFGETSDTMALESMATTFSILDEVTNHFEAMMRWCAEFSAGRKVDGPQQLGGY